MRITLVNQSARATILPERGGLLSSLVLPFADGAYETLFMPSDFNENESGWPGGGAPIMFPFAGRTFHEERPFFYDLNGQVFNMPLHGFSWAKPWTVKESGDNHVLLAQEDGPGTRELFPFTWRQETKYLLHADSLSISYKVTNLGALAGREPMPVAVGIHPYIRLEDSSSKALLFCDAPEVLQVTPAGTAGKKSPREEAGKPAPLDAPLYRNLILTGMRERKAGLCDSKNGRVVSISWDDASAIQFLVLWRKGEEPFHCVEPWMGLPDAVSNGAGLKKLATGESLTLGFTFKSATKQL